MEVTNSTNISEEPWQRILDILKHIHDSAPADVKKAIPNVFTMAKTCISACFEIYHIYKAEKVADNAFTATTQQEFDIFQGQANKILSLGIASNAICLAVECYRLKQFWEAIKNAENIVNESGKKVETISEKIEAIRKSIYDLDLFVAQLRECNMLDFMEFTEKKDKIKDSLNDLRTDIADLKYKIDGSLVQVKLRRSEHRISSISHGLSGLVSILTTGLLADVGNPWLVGMNMILASSRIGIAIGGIMVVTISKADIEKLEKELIAIDELESIRNEIDKLLRAKIEEHVKLLRELQRKAY